MSQGAVVGVRAHGRVRGRAARALVLGIGVAGVAVLTGCTADPPPQVIQSDYTQPPASAPSPSAEAAPVRPSAMQSGDDVGALAAGGYFLDLYRYVLATGELTEWDEVADPTCSFCSNVHELVSDAYADGGTLEGVDFDATEGRVVGFDETFRVHAVEFRYTASEGRQLDAAGTVVRTFAAKEGFIILDVGFDGTGWKLVTGDARDEAVE